MDCSVLLFKPNPQISILFSSSPHNPIQLYSQASRPTNRFLRKSATLPPPQSLLLLQAATQRRNAADLQLRHLILKGRLHEAVSALENGWIVDAATYVSLIQSCVDCNSIALGRRLHGCIGSVRGPTVFVNTKLVGMYAKCGSLEEARKMFDGMEERNFFTWSALIGGYTRERRWEEVVVLFYRMMLEGCKPDGFLVHRVLQACANSRDLMTGRLLHSIAVRGGFFETFSGDHIANSTLAMYIKCGKLTFARKLFEKMDRRDLVAWNTIMSGYCKFGENEEALRLFEAMHVEGVKPSIVTWNIVITSYNNCGFPDKAMEMMKNMRHSGLAPDVFTWTTMISGLAQNNQSVQALDLFRHMLLMCAEPNEMTLAVVASSCASLKALGKGKGVHSLVIKMGHAGNLLVCNSLIDMYSKCGRLEHAETVFCGMLEKDVFSWNSMIGSYVRFGYHGKAYDLFAQMEALGVQQNVITWNTLISGYMQNGDEDQAMELVQKMEISGVGRSTASWNLLISGSMHNGNRNNALGIFRQMQSLFMKPNRITILSVLPACANLMSTWKVKETHACVLHLGLQNDISILNSFIDTYAKSGDIASAQTLFNNIQCRDIITWNSIISGYIMHRHPRIALDLFDRMEQEETKPNQATLASILHVHGLLRMVNEGKKLFSSMVENYQLTPGIEHYAALVELLCRSGRLEEALEFIEKMPIEPNSVVWSSLLSGCRFYGNTRIAKLAAEHLIQLEPRNLIFLSLFLQLSAICWCSDTSKLLKLNKCYKIDEALGYCWMEHSKMVLKFSSGETSNPKLKAIHAKLDALAKEIKMARYDFHERLIGIEEEEREASSGTHSEKLAIAFSLITHPSCRTIRIIKNLRMCYSCHTIAKYISMRHECEILLKDPKCLHHFKNGRCSCQDYW